MTENPDLPVESPGQQPDPGVNPVSPSTGTTEEPVGSKRKSPAGPLLAWLLILATILVSQIPPKGEERVTEQETQATTLQLMGRYAVGMKSILGNNAAVLDRSIPQLEKAVEVSENPRKRLYFIPVLMELTKSEDGLVRLEKLARDPGNDPVAKDASVFLKLYRQGSDSLSAEQYRVIEQYGWIGKLALSHDREASDPLRKEVIGAAIRTFIVSFLFALSLVAVLMAGCIILVIAIVLWKKKRLYPAAPQPQRPGSSLLESFALFLTGLILLPALSQWMSPNLSNIAVLSIVPILILALCWPCLRGYKWRDVRMALGWYRGRGILREMGAGILGYLAGLPLLAVMFIPVLILSRTTGSVPSHPIVNRINENPFALLLIMGLACIWAPFVEETFFRGAFFGYLRRRLHWSVSGILTGLLFAVIHPQGWIAVPLLGTIGFTLSAIRHWRSSIIASVTAHALNNGVVLILAILMLT